MSAIEVTLNDAYLKIKQGSLRWSHQQGARGIMSFVTRSDWVADSGESLTAGSNARLFWLGTNLFGGIIWDVRKQRVVPGDARIWLECDCVSWEARLEGRWIDAAVYSGKNAGEIALQLITDFANLEAISEGDVQDGMSSSDLGIVVFRNMSVAEALDYLANRSDYVWWLAPGLELYFVPQGTVADTPLVVSPSNQNYRLPVDRITMEDYYNEVSLEVPWSVIPPLEESFVGDGAATEFTLTQPVDNITIIELNGVEQKVGVRDVDTDKDWYYELGSKVISQDGALPILTGGDALLVKYHELGGNTLTLQDATEVAARQLIEGGTGIHHIHYSDDTIDSVSSANAKLAKLLDSHCPGRKGASAGTTPEELKFEIDSYVQDGEYLRPGNLITLQFSTPTVDEQVVMIQSIDATDMPDSSYNQRIGLELQNFLRIQVTAVPYRPVPGMVEMFRRLAEVGSGGASSGGGSGKRNKRFVFCVATGGNNASPDDPAAPCFVVDEQMGGGKMYMLHVNSNKKGTGTVVLDIVRSRDWGATWVSILDGTKVSLSAGADSVAHVDISTFATAPNDTLEEGDLIKPTVVSGPEDWQNIVMVGLWA